MGSPPGSGMPADRQYLHALEKMALQYSSALRVMRAQYDRVKTAWASQCVKRRDERACYRVMHCWADKARGFPQERQTTALVKRRRD